MKNGLIIDEYGTKRYYLNDQLHRVDGPAIEYVDGSMEWHLNGKRHRVDGPAVEKANGTRYWYLSGCQVSRSEWELYRMDLFVNHRKMLTNSLNRV